MFLKKNIIAVTLLSGTILVSCADDEISGLDYSQNRIIASVQMPHESRTAMGDAVDGAVGVLWSQDDKIGVFEASGTAQKCYAKTTESANTDEAVFAVSGSDAFTTPMYAYYPYSEDNNGKLITSLVGNLAPIQEVDGKLHGDYKYGKVTSSSNQGHKVVFQHYFSMARVLVDASETPLSGEKIESLNIAVTRNDASVNIAGDFTFDAQNGKWTAGNTLQNNITLNWTEGVQLNEELTCYASLFPTVKTGDLFTITVTTQNYKAVFTAESKVDFSGEEIYTFPVKLSNFSNIQYFDKEGNSMDDYKLPSISEFGFQYSNNKTKLLDNELVWSNKNPSFQSKTSYSANIKEESGEITLTIPYLYDFKLIPTYKLSETGDYTISVNGVAQTSGETEVDFTQPVIYTITNKVGQSRNYTVKVTNTGLPVVVVKHSSKGDFSKDYKDIGQAILGNYRNKFVNFWIRAKDTDWVTDDQITIYNPDGTVDCATTGGARLRGNTSQDYPKKPFALKFTEKKEVLGMPAHNRWVLLANWLDHSMIRNAVAFDIAQAIEYAWRENTTIEPGIPWNVHGKNVELIVVDKDGYAHHVGNYFLCEQIKEDANRLPLTNGYLFEIDTNYDEKSQFKTTNGVPMMFKDEVDATTLNAVKAKIQGIEDNLNNGNYTEAYKNLDIHSVIDQWLIWELTMNREYGDPRSVYMFMEADGKLCAGPVWDFDRGTFQNTTNAANYGNSDRIKPYNEWMCWRSEETYIWYKQLIKDATFQQTVQKRWTVIKPELEKIVNKILNYGQTQAESYKYDSAMWPTNKADVQEWKSGFSDWSGDEQISDWNELINNFVTVYQARLAGMDALITEGKFTK